MGTKRELNIFIITVRELESAQERERERAPEKKDEIDSIITRTSGYEKKFCF